MKIRLERSWSFRSWDGEGFRKREVDIVKVMREKKRSGVRFIKLGLERGVGF